MNPVIVILAIPLLAAAALAALPWRALAARLNAAASLATFLAALTLFADRPAPSAFVFIDDFNVFFVVLTTFVAFTTSWFSASLSNR